MEWLIVLAALALLGLYAVGIYNALIAKRNRVSNAWSQIDVQLKRRYDLIPNLLNAVKGYLAHERGVLESVTLARAKAMASGDNVAARAAAEGALGRSLHGLLAIAEAYPDLKANQNVMALQEELGSTENRIAFARQHYNDAVTEYNTARETLPASLIAPAMGFGAKDLFELEPGAAERLVPTVQF